MLNQIKNIVAAANPAAWRITEVVEESAELFFVGKKLDTRRIKDTKKYHVTVWVRGEKRGAPAIGMTSVTFAPSVSENEIGKTVADAIYAAGFALNPDYALPDPVVAPCIEKTGELATASLAACAGKMAEAIYAPDNRADAHINSAEVFAVRSRKHIVTSYGTDVSYTDAEVNGEFVVQAKEPEDVEIHNQLEYDELNVAALTAKVEEALTNVCDRAHAQRILKSGNYDLILSGKAVAEVLSYYASRSSAAMLYPGYSTWKQGEDVQGEASGEKLSLTLAATEPYSNEGIPMRDRKLLDGGVLKTVHGGTRFCRYLGVEPTGDYRKVVCDNPGTLSFADMKKSADGKPCLWAVVFSDFQMDDFSGHFGGEMRLAYLIEGDKITPVTGGSVNGTILDAQKDMVFSTDRFTSAQYVGPYAVRFRDVAVAGTEN